MGCSCESEVFQWTILCLCISAATKQLFLQDWSYIIDRYVCLNYVTVSYDVAKCLWSSKSECACV